MAKKEKRRPHAVIQLRIPLALRRVLDDHVAARNKVNPLATKTTLTSLIREVLVKAAQPQPRAR